ncbi:MAG: hypothetical protein M1827_000229 [Pycnora praestabilis]|nr:MAG: hypothetical protein M1827_000229 [Pycnora praestabilis]
MEAQLPRYEAGLQYQDLPSVPSTLPKTNAGIDHPQAIDVDSVLSAEDHQRRATSVASMDDSERIAVKALEDLRADFVQSPPRQHSSLPNPSDPRMSVDPTTSQQPEPLLSLLTSQHPMLSTAINGSLSAYSSSKSYSPRFRYGAEFVERHIGSPVASTVGSVGRRTGVEGGVRWWLQRNNSDTAEAEGANKRRKVRDNNHDRMDVERGIQDLLQPTYSQRRPSEGSFAESLPAYDDQRSPSYEESGALVMAEQSQDDRQGSRNSTWQSRLMLSTSGLGVAMSEESLRSLKYCLTWLRWANVHLGKVIIALNDVLEEWDKSQQRAAQSKNESNAITDGNQESDTSISLIQKSSHDQASISQRIQTLKNDVLQTLKKVVEVVSKYAGGALPENARNLVRRHLTSLPQRFHIASTSNAPSDSLQPASETATSAHRVMVLAKEGLDMMAQVSGVLDGTIISAEEWCERLGRGQRGEPESPTETQADTKDSRAWDSNDTQMTGSDEKTG